MQINPEKVEYLLATLISAYTQINEIIEADPPDIYLFNLRQQQHLLEDACNTAAYLLQPVRNSPTQAPPQLKPTTQRKEPKKCR